MRYLLAIGLVLGLSAFAKQENWTKTFTSDGCGFSESEAQAQAKAEAHNEASFYESVCKGAQGTYTASFSSGDCESNPQDMTCPIECSVTGTATCTF
jgi:hypothetical protein